MARTEVLKKAGGYSEAPEVHHVEDFDLWVRCAGISMIENLPEILYVYRDHVQNVSSRNIDIQIQGATRIAAESKRKLIQKAGSLRDLMDCLFEFRKFYSSDPYALSRKQQFSVALKENARILKKSGKKIGAALRTRLVEASQTGK